MNPNPTQEQIDAAGQKMTRLCGEYEARTGKSLDHATDADWDGLIDYLNENWPAHAAAVASRTSGIRGIIEHPRTVAKFED